MAVSVGNEALVDWTDHLVPLEKVISYVRRVRAAIEQPVTVADNYRWWARHGSPLAAEVDFLGVHTYPICEGKTIDTALAYMESIERSVRRFPASRSPCSRPAGRRSRASSGPGQRGEPGRHYRELREWAAATGTTVFFFEAFDEPWKGNPDDPLDAEKHFGLLTSTAHPSR